MTSGNESGFPRDGQRDYLKEPLTDQESVGGWWAKQSGDGETATIIALTPLKKGAVTLHVVTVVLDTQPPKFEAWEISEFVYEFSPL